MICVGYHNRIKPSMGNKLSLFQSCSARDKESVNTLNGEHKFMDFQKNKLFNFQLGCF